MATGCQNMPTTGITSSGSQISSINTYRISKQNYKSFPSSPVNTQNNNNESNNISNTSNNSHLNEEKQKKQNSESANYVDLNHIQSIEYAHHQSLKIKTKSIENTLLPLVNQITTLVNFKEGLKSNNEKTQSALIRVGQAVSMAVDRFVQVGENIAYENPNIKFDMLVACTEAKESGAIIKSQAHLPNNQNKSNQRSDFPTSESNDQIEKFSIVQAANSLLNSVTKVLLLADVVIINQLLSSKNKVLQTLNKLESVIDFWNFVTFFTQYGTDLIELAHMSGERQNDLKDEKLKSQLSSARWILEKSTQMILSASKTYLKHLECECAKENICLVYSFLQEALDIVHYVAVESGTTYRFTQPVFNAMFKTLPVQISFTNSFRQFEDVLDLISNHLLMENESIYLINALNGLIESTQDFTDSLYINNEQRERIIRIQNEIRERTLITLRNDMEKKVDENNVEEKMTKNVEDSESENSANSTNSNNFKTILNDLEILKKLLLSQTMQSANFLFRENQDATLLGLIKTYSASNHYDLLIETLDKFKEYADHVLEIVKLLRHISTIDVFEVTCEHHYNVFEYLSKMIQSGAGTAALYPDCKSSMENLYLYCESWENQINDLSILVKEMQDVTTSLSSNNRGDNSKNSNINSNCNNKTVYFSLPRPGKHGNATRISSLPRGSKLDSDEQAKMAKLGLEMKLITSEIDAEANKWNEPQNEVVKIAKSMSEMAYEIHLFTRGEGNLKTTQDLFLKAQTFLNHGVILNNIIKDFLGQVPNGYLKDELIQLLEKLPVNFKELKSRLKQVTVGKKATFNKVDWVIQETRNFMNLVAKLVTSCFLCCTKYNISYESCETQFDINPEEFFFNKPSINNISNNSSIVNDNSKIIQNTINNTNLQQGSKTKGGLQNSVNGTSNTRSDSCGPIPYRQKSVNESTTES